MEQRRKLREENTNQWKLNRNNKKDLRKYKSEQLIRTIEDNKGTSILNLLIYGDKTDIEIITQKWKKYTRKR